MTGVQTCALPISRRSEIINKVALTRGPKPGPKIDCLRCLQKSLELCECLKNISMEMPVLVKSLQPSEPLSVSVTRKISRPVVGRFHSENSPKPGGLSRHEGTADPWDCPRFCDFETEMREKKKLITIDEVAPNFTVVNESPTTTIVVQLEQMCRLKSHRQLPTAIRLGTEQRFQVVFGKVSSWTSEPPERIGLSLVRGDQIINILPLSCPNHLDMVEGDKLRVRICPPVPNPRSAPLKASSGDGIYWVRSFRNSQVPEKAPRRHLSHLTLPANPRAKIATSSLSES